MFTSKSWMVPLSCINRFCLRRSPVPWGLGGKWMLCVLELGMAWRKKKNQSKMQLPDAMVHGELLRVGEGQTGRLS